MAISYNDGTVRYTTTGDMQSGAYTAIVNGANGGTGIGLVGVFTAP